MSEAVQEGWYTDPFGRHEARWFSAGTPTELVRDAAVESYDEPPDEEPLGTATRIDDAADGDPADLYRSDDGTPEHRSLNERMGEKGEFGSTWGSHVPFGQ